MKCSLVLKFLKENHFVISWVIFTDWLKGVQWYGSTNVDNSVSKNAQISDKILNFTTNSMKDLRGELTAEGQTLAEVKIQRRNFQADLVSPLLFFIAMLPLNYTFRKFTVG